MNRKITGGVLLVIGIVLIVVGVLLMYVIVPGMAKFPDDVDTTRIYTGDMEVLLNADTFEFMTDIPVDLERQFETVDSTDDLALVREEQILYSDGVELQRLVKHYVIDRETMEYVTDYPDDWADRDLQGFWDREGLVMGWPIDTERQDYPGWSDDYRDTVTLEFVEAVDHDLSDMEVYYYTSHSDVQQIDPAQVEVMGLPLELEKDVFADLIQNADVSDTLKNAMPVVLAQWEPDTVTLVYYYEYDAEYWIEPETGVLIDTHKIEIRKVGLGEEFVEAIPLLAGMDDDQREASRVPVFVLEYRGTDETVQDAADDAQDAIDQLTLFGAALPFFMVLAGALLGIAGLFMIFRRDKPVRLEELQ